MGRFNSIDVHVNGTQDYASTLQTYGIVVLKPNIVDNRNVLDQKDISKSNTKYIVKWNFDLDGKTINIPKNCIIEIDGGCLSNGTLHGFDQPSGFGTILVNTNGLPEDEILVNITRTGEWKKNETSETAEEIENIEALVGNREPSTAIPSYMGRVTLSTHIADAAYWALYTLTEYNQKMLIQVTTNGDIWIPFDEHDMLVLIQDDGESFTDLEIQDIRDISEISTNYLQFDLTSDIIVIPRGSDVKISDLGAAMSRGEITDYTGEVKKANILTQSMINKVNTVYVIQYDFDLNGQIITIPEGCVLKFEGGSLNNGTLAGQDTSIEAELVKIFDTNVYLSGKFTNTEWEAEWFGVNQETFDNQVYINHAINQISAIEGGTLFIHNDCAISDTIWLKRNVSIIGTSTREGTGTNFDEGGTLIKCVFANKNKWAISTTHYNGSEVDYQQLDFDENRQRLSGIRIENLNIVTFENDGSVVTRDDSEPIFGGIRIAGLTFGVLQNIKIFGVKYGIAASWCWCSTFSNIRIASAKCIGLYFGTAITTLCVEECSMLNFEKYIGGSPKFDFQVLNYPSDLTLPYYSEQDIQSVGICCDGKNNINFISCTIEKYDVVALLYKGKYKFDHTYLEFIGKSIAWAYSECIVDFYNSFGDFTGIRDRGPIYEFGAYSKTRFNIKSVPCCRCYPSNGEDVEYIVDAASNVSFYDTYDEWSDSTSSAIPGVVEKTPQKKFVNFPNEFSVIRSSGYKAYPDNNERIKSTNALGYKGIQIIDEEISERINCSESKDITIYLPLPYWVSPSGEYAIDKNITVYGAHELENVSMYLFNNVIGLQRTNITFPSDSLVNCSSGSLFSVIEKADINVYTIDTTKYLVRFDGDVPGEANITIRNTDVLASLDSSKILHPDTVVPAVVRIYQADGTLYATYTNTARPTKGLYVGYTFIENGKIVVYKGNDVWVNSDGIDTTNCRYTNIGGTDHMKAIERTYLRANNDGLRFFNTDLHKWYTFNGANSHMRFEDEHGYYPGDHKGATAARTALTANLGDYDEGYDFYDTDLNKILYFGFDGDNKVWRDATGLIV